MNESEKDKQNQDYDAMAKRTFLKIVKKEWRKIESILVQGFLDQGMSGEQARLKVAYLKSKYQNTCMEKMDVLYEKIVTEEANRDVGEQNNSQEGGSSVAPK